MRLSELLYEGEYLFASDVSVFDTEIKSVVSDSGRVERGSLFVSLKGTRTDGARYICESFGRGAVAVLCESPPHSCSAPYIAVENARKTLALILHRFWGRAGERMRLFAVTGTNGKTSTCCYLREILMSAGIKTGYIGTLKSYIDRERLSLGRYDDEKMSTMTTPDPEQTYKLLFEMDRAGVECVVIEASSHALRLDKLYPLSFSAGVFTNFSPEHLDFHADMNDYLNAKCKLLSQCNKMYLNADDPVCFSLRESHVHSVTFGEHPLSDYRLINVKMHGARGVSYEICRGQNTLSLLSSGIGRFSVYNSLAAASIALGEGISEASVKEGISQLKGIDGRLEKLKLPKKHAELTVIVDYAHTERALRELLKAVSAIKGAGQRIVTVFGCGGDRDRTKRAPMGRCASQYSDVVVVTEDNSRNEDPNDIIRDIVSGIDKSKEYKIIHDRKKAIEYVIKNARKDDIILLVGKGHEEYEIKEGIIRPFSEKRIVYELLGTENAEE